MLFGALTFTIAVTLSPPAPWITLLRCGISTPGSAGILCDSTTTLSTAFASRYGVCRVHITLSALMAARIAWQQPAPLGFSGLHCHLVGCPHGTACAHFQATQKCCDCACFQPCGKRSCLHHNATMADARAPCPCTQGDVAISCDADGLVVLWELQSGQALLEVVFNRFRAFPESDLSSGK
jgi:hypothetical protein